MSPDPVLEAKMAVSKKVNRMVGRRVVGLGDTISMLTAPDVLPLLKDLIEQIETKE